LGASGRRGVRACRRTAVLRRRVMLCRVLVLLRRRQLPTQCLQLRIVALQCALQLRQPPRLRAAAAAAAAAAYWRAVHAMP
jgi:hypothetical protein